MTNVLNRLVNTSEGFAYKDCHGIRQQRNLGTWKVFVIRLESDRWVNVFSVLSAFN